MLSQPLDLRMRRERRELGVAVILTNEDDRQLPEAGNVERLVKRSGLAGAVAEEDYRDLALFSFLPGKRRAQREWNGTADDTGGGDESGFLRDDVHGAAFAAAISGGAPGDLSHEFVYVGSLGDGVTVRPMAAVDVIVGAQQAARTDGNGFLANAQMEQADDLPFRVKRRDFFFEGPDQPHAAQKVDNLFVIFFFTRHRKKRAI